MKENVRIKRAAILLALVVVGAAFICLGKVGAKSGHAEMAMHQAITEIQSGPDGSVKNQGFHVMNHPSGVYSYTKSWDDSNEQGVVRFSHGKNSFEVSNVTILTGLGDSNFPENGVDNWSLMLGIGPEKMSSYEDAHKKITSLLAQLRAAGWQRYIEGSDPRLSGKQAMLYALSHSGQTYSLDSTYTLTPTEWKQLVAAEPVWEFYADGIFLNLTLSYWASSVPDVGRYLVNIKISTAADNYSPYFSDDDDDKKRHWKKYLSDRLAPVRDERSAVEGRLNPHEFKVDNSYVPPPFEALDFSAQTGTAQ
ncbi:hypothetical protein [Paraburkholderia bannensis]|uniref:hypothetical protein n=1 Tax=Paraburkholderia bannensis TaxID=765414 RepID=UPI002ABD4C6D|nr:hypothetical protein [Paraburkholderia bannensis]